MVISRLNPSSPCSAYFVSCSLPLLLDTPGLASSAGSAGVADSSGKASSASSRGSGDWLRLPRIPRIRLPRIRLRILAAPAALGGRDHVWVPGWMPCKKAVGARECLGAKDNI